MAETADQRCEKCGAELVAGTTRGIPKRGTSDWWKIAMLVYERSEENAYHDDILMWEVTSITWGANTLLLGFILEALDKPEARPLIMVVSVVGIILTIFVARFFYLGKIGQRIAYGICQDIEKDFSEELSLHSKIHKGYNRAKMNEWSSASD
jgi:hypothetical protein